MRLATPPLIGLLVIVSYACALVSVPSATWATTALISLGAGMAAFATMATSAVLGARWPWVETLFGGLDRVYETHKWLGVAALAFASLHLLFKAGMDGWPEAAIVALPSPVTRLARQASFLALGLIVLLALNRRIPYRQWRWWHKLSGPLFLVVVAHGLSIPSPVVLASAGGIWLATMATLGVAGAAYKLLLYPLLSPHATYLIEAVVPGPSALKLVMRPTGRGVDARAGQFAFLSIHAPGLREPHPFTIASAGGAGAPVTFLIRALGDYTGRLVSQAHMGMQVDVRAPFGRFRRPDAGRAEIWIAGGIGISPFVAWLEDAAAIQALAVTLFLFGTPARQFPPVPDIRRLCEAHGVALVAMPEDADAATFGERLAAAVVAAGAAGVDVCFCGPAGLLTQVQRELRVLGVPPARLRHERFDFR